jgi:hypothetical protein
VDGWDVHVRRRRGVSVGGTQPSIGISLGKAPAGTESGVRWLAGLRRVSCCCRPADDHEKKGFLFRHPAKMDCCAIRRIAILRPCLVWENAWLGVAVTTGIALLLFVGAFVGFLLFQGISKPSLAIVLAFGASALIYLIAEELLVEAIEAEESLFSTATLFAGFLVLLAIKLFTRG